MSMLLLQCERGCYVLSINGPLSRNKERPKYMQGLKYRAHVPHIQSKACIHSDFEGSKIPERRRYDNLSDTEHSQISYNP